MADMPLFRFVQNIIHTLQAYKNAPLEVRHLQKRLDRIASLQVIEPRRADLRKSKLSREQAFVSGEISILIRVRQLMGLPFNNSAVEQAEMLGAK